MGEVVFGQVFSPRTSAFPCLLPFHQFSVLFYCSIVLLSGSGKICRFESLLRWDSVSPHLSTLIQLIKRRQIAESFFVLSPSPRLSSILEPFILGSLNEASTYYYDYYYYYYYFYYYYTEFNDRLIINVEL
jgi:hypothetical protein